MKGKIFKEYLSYWLLFQLHTLPFDEYALHLISMKLRFIALKPVKPAGHVMHQQFNIQQLYALSTLYLCFLYISENKQRLVPLTA